MSEDSSGQGPANTSAAASGATGTTAATVPAPTIQTIAPAAPVPAPVPTPGALPAPANPQPPCPPGVWTGLTGGTVLLLSILILAAGLLIPLLPMSHGTSLLASWIVIFALMIGLVTVIGKGITGLDRGIFIDPRNMISLSRVQMVCWTILVLSAWISAVLGNYALPSGTIPAGKWAIDVAIPSELWGAMGISIASLIASPLLLSNKAAKGADPTEASQTLQVMDPTGNGTYGYQGQVVNKNCPKDSTFSDIFRGEETGNADHVDLAKVQMFLFTVVLLGGYAVAVGQLFVTSTTALVPGLVPSLPPVSQGFIALLALSHAGYLGNKAIPHSQTGTSTTGTSASATSQ